ncbi:hypothetical protein PFICI_00931 [Pestalotiopsis fici W106-1]|uniref:Zn(2)-C6 fungal-type domain-containing protein n=1 Tax=Pestalotiopsis fici (strain W106-1 / CGMCC3.15140) TaxID=1229662 RepID=W3XM19_PESFW|nr:uncharacterized protein PFICI_00931 [Pestalotiopsis fici W106-1]ETS87103.1 hypothetical protein PFICI_00931 [Pestalotiopsis fici W106-1]
MASRCQRRILSCSRCRKRKLKCDRRLPACSQCLAANTTCNGIAAGSQTEVPRSIAHHLESEIARLEAALFESGQLDDVQASDILLQIPVAGASRSSHGQVGDPLHLPAPEPRPPSSHNTDTGRVLKIRESILTSAPLHSIVHATMPPDSGATELLSRVRMGMTPSTARIGDITGTLSTGSYRPVTSNVLPGIHVLQSMPVDIVHRLMMKYLDTIHPENPFLTISDIHAHFGHVVQILLSPDPGPVEASYDLLVVYLILAMSLTLAAFGSRHEERCTAFSMSVFKEGVQNLYGLSSFPSEIARLQVTLLILHYATVFPRLANVWVLSGAAMRSCLELGLHRELPASIGSVDSQTLHLRRRVFWAAYCMDRSICSALQRPVCIPDVAIDAKLPSALSADDDIDDSFLGSISYHRLLSEMLHVHYQGESIPSDLSWDDWLADMETRLRDWHNMYRPNASHQAMTEFNMARGLMILHRPSPRLPMPSPSSLLIAFKSASTVARTYREHMRARFFCRPWLSAHFTLEAATVVLFCLRHGNAAIIEYFTPAQIFKMTKLFTQNFLDIAAQGGGWPEINAYAGTYERLLCPLLERVFLHSSTLSDAFGPAQDAELLRLLYPDPAHLEKLRFGDGLPEASDDLASFDFDLFMADDNFWEASVEMPGDT